MGRQFINPHLKAPNVLEIDFPAEVTDSLAPLVEDLRKVKATRGPVTIGHLNLDVTCPADWQSDIRWISQGDIAAFRFFEDLFHRSGVAERAAQYIEHDREIRLYSGFFVTRTRCSEALLHHDWIDARNDAFNMMTPISANCAEMGLVYRDIHGEIGQFSYRRGKALLLGDHFLHSTAPGETPEPTVLLSFVFGTDRMDRWDTLSRIASRQGRCHCRPDGTFVRQTDNVAASPGTMAT